MSRTPSPGASRGPGRPSVVDERREQIVAAFVRLVADRGLDAVTSNDVAAEAGVARSAIRHFVGNRGELVAGAVGALVDHYRAEARAALGGEPSPHELVAALFSPAWVDARSVEDRAFDALQQEAARDEATRHLVREAFDQLVDEVAAALRRAAPTIPDERIQDAAYVVVCLAEQNVRLQALGYPVRRSRAAAAQAAAVVEAVLGAG